MGQKPKIISIDPNGSHYDFGLRYDSSDLRFRRFEIIPGIDLTYNNLLLIRYQAYYFS